MPLQHFRGVIWPRSPQEVDGKMTYRYVVIGMLVTDEPIETVEGRNEIVVDGHAGGIAEALVGLKKVKKNYNLGTADCVLTSLPHITDGEPEDQEYLEATEAKYLATRTVKFQKIPEGVYTEGTKTIKIIDGVRPKKTKKGSSRP